MLSNVEKCGNDWHDEIRAEFQYLEFVKLKQRNLFFFIGTLTKGIVNKGYQVYLTNFQINMKPKIMAVEFVLKKIDGLKTEYVALGIKGGKEKEELIQQWVVRSSKKIMIIEKYHET